MRAGGGQAGSGHQGWAKLFVHGFDKQVGILLGPEPKHPPSYSWVLITLVALLQTVVPGNPVDDFKLLVRTVSSLVRANALRTGTGLNVSFGSKANEEKVQLA